MFYASFSNYVFTQCKNVSTGAINGLVMLLECRVFAFITTSCSPNSYKSENSAWDRGQEYS